MLTRNELRTINELGHVLTRKRKLRHNRTKRRTHRVFVRNEALPGTRRTFVPREFHIRRKSPRTWKRTVQPRLDEELAVEDVCGTVERRTAVRAGYGVGGCDGVRSEEGDEFVCAEPCVGEARNDDIRGV